MYSLQISGLYFHKYMQSALSYLETNEMVIIKMRSPWMVMLTFFFFSSETHRWENNNKGVPYTSSGPHFDTETPTEHSPSQSKCNFLAK